MYGNRGRISSTPLGPSESDLADLKARGLQWAHPNNRATNNYGVGLKVRNHAVVPRMKTWEEIRTTYVWVGSDSDHQEPVYATGSKEAAAVESELGRLVCIFYFFKSLTGIEDFRGSGNTDFRKARKNSAYSSSSPPIVVSSSAVTVKKQAGNEKGEFATHRRFMLKSCKSYANSPLSPNELHAEYVSKSNVS
jgi:hypothetical protein